MKEIIDTLHSKKYKIRFGWLGKKDYAEIDYQTDTITMNIELFISAAYIHEYEHGEGDDLPVRYGEEEAVVRVREKQKIKRAKEKDLRYVARYIEQNYLLPQLIKKYIPELMKEYDKKAKQKEQRIKNKRRKRAHVRCGEI